MHVLNLSLVESVYNLVLKQKHQNINISRYSKSQVRIQSEKQNKEIDPKTLKNTNEYSSKS